MTIELTLTNLLKPLVANRVWWDVPPDGYVVVDPIILLEIAGGDAGWNVDDTVPDLLHARIRVSVWAKTRLAANNLARLIEETIAAANLNAQPYSAFNTDHDRDMGYYGTHQDFGFWYPKP